MSVTSFAAAQLIRALPRVPLSRAVGKLCDQALPPSVSKLVQSVYCTAYPVNLSEASESGPFLSFDAFFTRRLREGVRPISSDGLVSPADGKLSAKGPVDAGSRIIVKEQSYDVAELIGDADDARRYRGGQFAVVYLAPSDYHRVHSPAEGEVTLVRSIAGDLYPVNSIGEKHIDGLFVRNHRVTLALDTQSYGRISVVLVGATIVGRISISLLPGSRAPQGVTRLSPGEPVKKGDELGMFHLGSTVVLMFEPGVSLGRSEGVIRYGQSLMRDG